MQLDYNATLSMCAVSMFALLMFIDDTKINYTVRL